MSKNYEEELSIMEKGLDSINKVITSPKNRFIQSRALVSRGIQEVRIEEFKRGYAFHDNELRGQMKISGENIVSDKKPTIQKELKIEVIKCC